MTKEEYIKQLLAPEFDCYCEHCTYWCESSERDACVVFVYRNKVRAHLEAALEGDDDVFSGILAHLPTHGKNPFVVAAIVTEIFEGRLKLAEERQGAREREAALKYTIEKLSVTLLELEHRMEGLEK